jgi:hypothetical protein
MAEPDMSFAHDGTSPQRIRDNSRRGSFGFCRTQEPVKTCLQGLIIDDDIVQHLCLKDDPNRVCPSELSVYPVRAVSPAMKSLNVLPETWASGVSVFSSPMSS